jgi:hypothetical protein
LSELLSRQLAARFPDLIARQQFIVEQLGEYALTSPFETFAELFLAIVARRPPSDAELRAFGLWFRVPPATPAQADLIRAIRRKLFG